MKTLVILLLCTGLLLAQPVAGKRKYKPLTPALVEPCREVYALLQPKLTEGALPTLSELHERLQRPPDYQVAREQSRARRDIGRLQSLERDRQVFSARLAALKPQQKSDAELLALMREADVNCQKMIQTAIKLCELEAQEPKGNRAACLKLSEQVSQLFGLFTKPAGQCLAWPVLPPQPERPPMREN